MGKKKELELIYNGNINENSLKKIISFLNIKTKNKTIKNILDSKLIDDKRLTIEGTDNILNKHCNFEAENMESNKILPAIYKLEEKYLIPDGKFLFSPFNSRLNIKIENEINSPEERSNFAEIYSKFKKQYRYKKRLSYDFDNFRVDITLVKFAEGQNILLSDIDKKT